MNYMPIPALVILLVAVVIGFRLVWELLQQNGRVLLRMEALEKRLEELKAENGERKVESDQTANHSHPQSIFPGGEEGGVLSDEQEVRDRESRFGNRSLTVSKIKRDGLKAGTVAPDFRLPRLDGGELALSDLRGKLVLLVFSSPNCGPCNALAPKLEKFHRKHPQLEMAMISKEDPEANREKVKEHELTFPVMLQKKWEVSRDYAFFGTPVGYLIDSAGVIIADAAIGVDAVLELAKRARRILREKPTVPTRGLADWSMKAPSKLLDWLNRPLGKLKPTYDHCQQKRQQRCW
jgi:peroxiredoxin